MEKIENSCMQTNKKSIGIRIKKVRTDIGVNQTEFGMQIGGLKKSAVSAYEQGDNFPPPDTMIKIAEAGNVTLDWLLTGKELHDPEQNPEYRRKVEAVNQIVAERTADLKLMQQVIEAVEEHLQNNQLTMSPAKIAELITVLYEETLESNNQQVNKGTVSRMIKLAT